MGFFVFWIFLVLVVFWLFLFVFVFLFFWVLAFLVFSTVPCIRILVVV